MVAAAAAAVGATVAGAVAVGFAVVGFVAAEVVVVVEVVAGVVVGPVGVGGLVGALAESGLVGVAVAVAVGERDSSWVVAAAVVGARTVAEGAVVGPFGVRWGSC